MLLSAIQAGFGKEPVSLKNILQIASFGSLGWLLSSLLGTNPK